MAKCTINFFISGLLSVTLFFTATVPSPVILPLGRKHEDSGEADG